MKFSPAPERVLASPTQFDQAPLRLDAIRLGGFRKTRGVDDDSACPGRSRGLDHALDHLPRDA